MFTEIKPGPHGTFQAVVMIDGVTFNNKSYFPATWTREKVISKICESMEQCINKPYQQSNKNWVVRGITADGIKIETILNDLGHIITAYPMLKE